MPSSQTSVSRAIATAEIRHSYNDDLLASHEARARAAREFPAVFHVLDHDELRRAFGVLDDRAQAAKRRSQAAGFWAITLALGALMLAASEAVWHDISKSLQLTLLIASAVMGIAGTFIGWFGVLRGPSCAAWLNDRLHAERLRQFHFQSFIWRIREIAESLTSATGPDEYRRLRDQWFHGFQARFHPGRVGVELESVLNPNIIPRMWTHDSASAQPPSIAKSVDLSQVFLAYRTLRLEEQFSYATHQLRRGDAHSRRDNADSMTRRIAFPLHRLSLSTQATLLRNGWTLAFAGLLVLHILILARHIVPSASTPSAWLGVLVIWTALIAIALKTLAEGLGIDREIERLEEYRALMSERLLQFDPHAEAKNCLHHMLEIERIAFEEMRAFLRTHSQSRFIF